MRDKTGDTHADNNSLTKQLICGMIEILQVNWPPYLSLSILG